MLLWAPVCWGVKGSTSCILQLVVCFKYRTAVTSLLPVHFHWSEIQFLEICVPGNFGGNPKAVRDEEHCNWTRHDTENVQFRHQLYKSCIIFCWEYPRLRWQCGASAVEQEKRVSPPGNIPRGGCSRNVALYDAMVQSYTERMLSNIAMLCIIIQCMDTVLIIVKMFPQYNIL